MMLVTLISLFIMNLSSLNYKTITFMLMAYILSHPPIMMSPHTSNMISYIFSLLTVMMFLLTFLAMDSLNNLVKNSLILTLILMMILMLFFNENSLFMFYVWYEFSLVAMFMIIMMNGYQPERLQAAMAMMFYTVTASAPLLIILFILKESTMISTFNLSNMPWTFTPNHIIYIMMIMSFLVKLPMYPTHLWLPKAHVEAPVYGSMLLASLMLKMGSYGMLRFMNFFLNNLSLMVMTITLYSTVIISLICMTEIDMKVIIAYSSVAHMGMMAAAMMTLNYWGFLSAIWTSVAHALSSSMMFYGANIIYLITNTRSMIINKSTMTNYSPFLMIWFITLVACASAPLTLNFISEIISIVSIVAYNSKLAILVATTAILTMAYSMILYSNICHGKSLISFNLTPMSISTLNASMSHTTLIIATVLMMNTI